MKILVTGGAGFIGCHLSKRLIELGHDVTIVDNFNQYYEPKLKRDRVKQLLKGLRFALREADITNPRQLDAIFRKRKIDAVCHLAAQAGVRYSIENPTAYVMANVVGTLNLLELSQKYRVKNFVFASSSSVYGDAKETPSSESHPTDRPASVYAATKKGGEALVYAYHSLYGFPATSLRFFTVYGPWSRPDMALLKFAKLIMEDKPIEIYNRGKMSRDWTYVDDIVDGIVRALNKRLPYEVVNLGNGRPVELMAFISTLEKHLGKNAKKKYLPKQAGDVLMTFADTRKARKLLGWKPRTSVDRGIKEFAEWFSAYYYPDPS